VIRPARSASPLKSLQLALPTRQRAGHRRFRSYYARADVVLGSPLDQGLPVLCLRRVWYVLDATNRQARIGSLYSGSGCLAKSDAFLTTRLSTRPAPAMLVFDLFTFKTIIMVVMDVPMLRRVLERIGVVWRDFSHSILPVFELCGGFLFLRPASAGSVFSDLAASPVGQCFEPAFSANSPTLAAHFGHDLRDYRFSNWRGGFGVGFAYRGEHYAAGVLDGVELGLAFALRHAQWSALDPTGVKLRGFSN
jgi:hypothetical protein